MAPGVVAIAGFGTGLARTLLRRFRNSNNETKASLAQPDTGLLDLFGTSPAASGVIVTPRSAMTCAPVRCAVQAISEAIGQLPVHVYSRADDGSKERAPDHPAYRLLHDEANEWTPASTFREQVTRDALLYPNGGFAFINRVDGRPVELIRLDPEISPVKVGSANGEPTYEVREGGTVRQIARQDMLHVPSPSLGGLIHDGREAIGLAIVMEQHAARLFGNGARPSGLLSIKGNTTPDALAKAKAAWIAAHGGNKSGGTAVIPAEALWQALTLTSVDAQFLELRKFAIEEIARIFRVPPHMLYELGRATWANSEQMGQEFVTYCLMAWIKRWEGEVRLKLFTPEERAGRKFFAEFLTDDFLRADFAARMDGFTKAIAARILNPNEARAAMNLAPYMGGDKFENPNTTSLSVAA